MALAAVAAGGCTEGTPGEAGAPGPAGPPGAQGPQGEAGDSMWTRTGDTISCEGNVSVLATNQDGVTVRVAGDNDNYLFLGGLPGAGDAGYVRIGGYSGIEQAGKNLVLQDSGGNVGIGTTMPAYTLDVVGTVSLDGLRPFPKGGNNGTATCATFCAGAQWGPVGLCLGAKDQRDGTYHDCGWVYGGATGDVVCACLAIY